MKRDEEGRMETERKQDRSERGEEGGAGKERGRTGASKCTKDGVW